MGNSVNFGTISLDGNDYDVLITYYDNEGNEIALNDLKDEYKPSSEETKEKVRTLASGVFSNISDSNLLEEGDFFETVSLNIGQSGDDFIEKGDQKGRRLYLHERDFDSTYLDEDFTEYGNIQTIDNATKLIWEILDPKEYQIEVEEFEEVVEGYQEEVEESQIEEYRDGTQFREEAFDERQESFGLPRQEGWSPIRQSREDAIFSGNEHKRNDSLDRRRFTDLSSRGLEDPNELFIPKSKKPKTKRDDESDKKLVPKNPNQLFMRNNTDDKISRTIYTMAALSILVILYQCVQYVL